MSAAAGLVIAGTATAQGSAAPAIDRGWRQPFIDEFNGATLGPAWEIIANYPKFTTIQSARIPENVVVENGMMRHLIKKETAVNPDDPTDIYTWTSGYVQTKFFRQRSGFWQTSMRIAGATGLNNAFWATTEGTPPETNFELDFVEAHYPSNPHFNWHAWRWPDPTTKRAYPSSINTLGPDFSTSFNTFGMLWTEGNDFVFYVNGVEHHRVVPNADEPTLGGPDRAADIKYSTAVMTFGGPIVDELDGESMDVDWVRVYSIEDALLTEDSFNISTPLAGGTGWGATWNTPPGANAALLPTSLDPGISRYRAPANGSLDLGAIGAPISRFIELQQRFNYNTDATWFLSFLVNRAPTAGLRLELISGDFTRGLYEVGVDGTITTAMDDSLAISSQTMPSGEDVLVTIMIKSRPSWQPVAVNSGTSIQNDEIYTRIWTSGDTLPEQAPLLNEWHTQAAGGTTQAPSVLRLTPLGTGSVIVDEIRTGNTFAGATATLSVGNCPGNAGARTDFLDNTTDSFDTAAYLRALANTELWTDYSGDALLTAEDVENFLGWLEACD